MANIRCGNCKATHTTVVEVKACYAAPKAAAEIFVVKTGIPGVTPAEVIATPATWAEAKKIALVGHNCEDWDGECYGEGIDPDSGQETYGCTFGGTATQPEPAVEIAEPPVAPKPTKPEKVEIAHGFYHFEDTVVKVQEARNGTGRIYAKALDPQTGTFTYVPGLVKRLEKGAERLTVEQAAAYGHLYGICVCCGRDLTDEQSIANGIGPVCAKKYFAA